MTSKSQALQRVFREYKEETGKLEATTREAVEWAVQRGLLTPSKPVDPLDRLARDMAKAMREEVRRDATTGRPYRANHNVLVKDGPNQKSLWFDIDENPPRPRMHRSLMQRREQIVGDATQLYFDGEHWNAANPTEEPIHIPLDFTDDVEWAKHADNDAGEVA